MINRKLVLLALLFMSSSLIAQIQRNAGQFVGGIYPGATIETFSSSTESDPQENYLMEDWMFGSIDLSNTDHLDIKQIALKFNVVSNRIEIKTERVVKEISISMIRKVEIPNPNSLLTTRLINGYEIGMDSETLYEELNSEGRFRIYLLHGHSVLQPDYNPQFDTGSKVERVILTETYYLRDSETSEFYEIKLRKKNIRKVISKLDPSVAQKIKNYNESVSDKYELQKLITYVQL